MPETLRPRRRLKVALVVLAAASALAASVLGPLASRRPVTLRLVASRGEPAKDLSFDSAGPVLSPDGRLLLLHDAGTIELCRADTLAPVRSFAALDGAEAIGFLGSSSAIVSVTSEGGGREVALLDVATGVVRPPPTPIPEKGFFALSNDRRFLFTNEDAFVVVLRDTSSWSVHWQAGISMGSPAMAISRRGTFALASDGGKDAISSVARVFDGRTGAVVATLPRTDATYAAAFSADEDRLLVASGGGKLALYDTSSWREIRDFSLPNAFSIAFSPIPGDDLAAVATNGTVVLYATGRPRELARCRIGPGSYEPKVFPEVGFLPDGSGFLVGFQQGCVQRWAIER